MSDVVQRARQSKGTSGSAIYEAVATVVEEHHKSGGHLLDVGCGQGSLWPYLAPHFDTYSGADVVRYDEFPSHAAFHSIDLDSGGIPLPAGSFDVTCGVETIEHVENPRAFMRELVRLTKPGGWVVISTPNSLSLLSKATLLVSNEFNAFRDGSYPAHITALLEVDLRRIAAESRLTDVRLRFTMLGRVPGTARHWPRHLGRLFPRALSDNVVLIGRTPIEVGLATLAK